MIDFQAIINFCNGNKALLAIIAVLTVGALICEKGEKVLKPFKSLRTNVNSKLNAKKVREEKMMDMVERTAVALTNIEQRLTANDELTQQLLEEMKGVKEDIGTMQNRVLLNEKDRLKSELFVYGNRCRRGMPMALDEYRHISDVYHKYHDDLHFNGDGENEYNYITRYFENKGWEES